MDIKRKRLLSPSSEYSHTPKKTSLDACALDATFDVATELQQRLLLIELCIEILISQTKVGEYWAEGYREVMTLLETLPLASGQFSLVKLHLENALDYCQRKEPGAAAYELRFLRGIVQGL